MLRVVVTSLRCDLDARLAVLQAPLPAASPAVIKGETAAQLMKRRSNLLRNSQLWRLLEVRSAECIEERRAHML